MFGRKARKIFDLVSQHYDYVFECFTIFENFFKEYLAGNKSDDYYEAHRKIGKIERLADDTRRELVKAFLEGSLLPSTRKELLQLVAMNDKIANHCQDITNQLVTENMRLPKILDEGLLEIIHITGRQFAVLSKALEMFFGNYEQLIKDSSLLREIEDLEHEVDVLESELIRDLFASEMKLSEKRYGRYFISKIADLSDMIEDISDEIQIMVVLRKV